MTGDPQVLQWLLRGDPAVRWQARRDLLDQDPAEVRSERDLVAREGWGARLLALQERSGLWGGGVYTPKWTSTTYTLLLLRRLGLAPDNRQARAGCRILIDRGFYADGGINLNPKAWKFSETCITGMVLTLGCYFRLGDGRLDYLARHLLAQRMGDGGWNCQRPRGATHSSAHTTIIVLEALLEFERAGGAHSAQTQAARAQAHEFLLAHRLYKSDKTGRTIKPAFTRLSFPPRWHYDILRALDYFRDAAAEPDERMADAVALLKKKEKGGRWPLQQRYPGRTFFELEQVGRPSRVNTLRALRVLRWWHSAG